MTATLRARRAALTVIALVTIAVGVPVVHASGQTAPPGSCLAELASVDVGGSAYGMAIDPVNGLVYVANNDEPRIDVIDGPTNSVVDSIDVSATLGAVDFLAVDHGANRLWASSFGDDLVVAIDLATGGVVASVPVTSAQQLAIDIPNGRLYASGQSNDVVVISLASETATGTLAVGGSSLGIAVDSAGDRVFVGDYTNGTLDIFDGSAGTLIDSFTSGDEPLTVAYDDTTGHVWLTSRAPGSVVELDPDTGADFVNFDYAGAQGLAINPAVGQGYVSASGGSELLAFSLADGGEIDTFPVGTNALVVVSRVDPVAVYVAGFDDGSVTVIGDAPPCPGWPTSTTTTTVSTTVPSSPTTVPASATARPIALTPSFTG